MSAPNTNTDEQQKKHRPALFGIGGSILWGALLLILLIVWISWNGNTPEEEGVQIEVTPGVGATTEETD